jgi:AraC-like ligand binding domain
MHAHFERHVYHRHSHETYSFGVTEEGAQSFSCRGAGRMSAAGMVMAFNPEEPHDGPAATEVGFTYRMVHLGPELVAGVLADRTGRRAELPLFDAPVIDDPTLARALRPLRAALLAQAPRLRQDELLDTAVAVMVGRAATRPAPQHAGHAIASVERVTEFLHAAYLQEISAAKLAELAQTSRFVLCRAFRSIRTGSCGKSRSSERGGRSSAGEAPRPVRDTRF